MHVFHKMVVLIKKLLLDIPRLCLGIICLINCYSPSQLVISLNCEVLRLSPIVSTIRVH